MCFYHQVIVDDVKKSELPFCLHFDETSTMQVKKQMDLTFPYWSLTHNEAWINFYTSLFFGHAEGEVANRIFQTMLKDDLPITKLCTLVRDGPNVNKTIVKKLEGKQRRSWNLWVMFHLFLKISSPFFRTAAHRFTFCTIKCRSSCASLWVDFLDL